MRRRDHRVHHLRRHEHRHRRPLGLVALEVGVEAVLEQVAHELAQLLDVLHAVRPLPLHVAPLRVGDVGPAGEPGPVRLHERTRRRRHRAGRRAGPSRTPQGRRAARSWRRGYAETFPLSQPLTGRSPACSPVFVRGSRRDRTSRHPRRPRPSGCTESSSRSGSCRRLPGASTPIPTLRADETRIRVERLNLDAASFRQLSEKHCGRRRRRTRRGAGDRRRRAARCRTRSPAPAACSSASSRRSAPSRRLGLKAGDRVATLVSLSLTPLRHRGRAGPLGRAQRAGPVRRHSDPLRPVHRRRAARRPAERARHGRHGRRRCAGADLPSRRGLRRPRYGPDGRRHRGSGEVRLALARGRSALRRQPYGRRRTRRGTSGRPSRPQAWPTPSPSLTPATRSRWPPP